MGRPVEKTSANHLRAWREFCGLTQKQLAEKIGTADNVIGLLESGERQLSEKWLRKLAPALGTTPGFLLDYSPYEMDPRYLSGVMAVPKDKRDQVLQIVEILKTGTDE